METKKVKVHMVDDNGNGYSKEIELFQSKYHQVLVNNLRDGYRYSQEWIFDNEEDAIGKCNLIEAWKNPPLDRHYYDYVYNENLWLPVSDGVNNENN